MKKAFSLVELLISLIIISLIIAAFAPIMTKKLTRGGVLGSGSGNSMDELLLTKGNSYKDGLYECFLSEDESYTNCKFHVPNNVTEISAVLVGGGGSGAGGVNPNVEKDIEFATNETELNKSLDIKQGMVNIRVANLIGAGGGGGIGYYDPKIIKRYIKECPKDVSITAYSDQNAVYCITKYNVRPADYEQYHNNWTAGARPVIKEPESEAAKKEIKVHVANFAKNDEAIGENPACWISNEPGTTNGDYPGYGRTVCNGAAGFAMCPLITAGGDTCNNDGGSIFTTSCTGKWRMPTKEEIGYNNWPGKLFEPAFYGQYGNSANALQLCGSNSIINCFSWEIDQCTAGGNYNYSCHPRVIIGPIESYNGNKGYLRTRVEYDTYKGQTNWIGDNKENGSIRCVLRAADPPIVNSFGGGGGAAGASISSTISIPDEIIRNNIGGKIVLNAGSGGSGAHISTNNESDITESETGSGSEPSTSTIVNATSGGYSEVTVVNSGNDVMWGYRVYGGIEGNSATETNFGARTVATTKCEEYNVSSNSWKTITCQRNGNYGNQGTKYLNSSTIATGGSGGTVSATTYGKGGTGGKGARDIEDRYGLDGANGYASIKYNQVISKGASGGAGSGACASRIEKISVKRGDVLDIIVGSGGKGGNIEVNGNGGNKSVIVLGDRFKYTMAGGKGGKTGTAGRKEGDNIIEPTNGLESEETICDISDDILSENDKNNIVFKHAGNIGTGGKMDEVTQNAMGGVGGLSGFSKLTGYTYTYGGCGGYFNEVCLNNDRNGISSASHLPSKLFATENYGTLGAGGGGGGWLYDLANPSPAGVGGDGLDGFVYLYWRKAGK